MSPKHLRAHLFLALTAILLFTVILPTGMRSAYASPTNKYNVSGTVGPSLCSSGFGANWDPSNNTCTILSSTEWDIAASTTLTNSGSTPSSPSTTLTNDGAIMNNGTLAQNGDLINQGNFTNLALVDNRGNVISRSPWAEFRGGIFSNKITGTFGIMSYLAEYGMLLNNGTITVNGTLGIGLGGGIINYPQGTLTMRSGGTLLNNGSYTNGGGILIGGGALLNNDGSGDLLIASGGSLLLGNGGVMINNGALTDKGIFNVAFGGGLTNNGGGILLLGNGGSLENNGTFTNNGNTGIGFGGGLVNSQNGVFQATGITVVNGSLINENILTLNGNLMLNSGGNFTNNADLIVATPAVQLYSFSDNGSFTDNGKTSILRGGNLTIDRAGTLDVANGGILTNNGTLINDGTLHIRKLGSLHNYNTVTLKRGVINDGSFWNWHQGVIDNKGPLTISVDAILYNYGTINNYATITNNGNILQECGGQIVNEPTGTYTGNPPIQACTGTPVFSSLSSLLLIGLTLPALLVAAKRVRRLAV